MALALSGPIPARAAEAAAEPAAPEKEILVIGTRLAGIHPERELDELGVESYGQSTIDELIGEIRGELGDSGEPFILVNGQRVSDLSEIGGLPVEALERVKILPRGSAVRVGGRTGQRVVDISLKKLNRSATLLVAPKVATEGDWHGERGEAILNYIRDSTRANLTIRARHESDLLESERGIEQPIPTLRYALGGNVIGFPGTTGEIDPLLSAAVGRLVTVAPVPATSNPTLNDFVPNANEAAFTDIGDFRTLRPKTRNYDLIGTFTTRLARWLSGTIGLRLNRSTRRSLRGLPQALFLLSPANINSPFSTTVALAGYGKLPIATRSIRDSGELNLALNGRVGSWTSFANARHFESTDDTRTDRRASSGNILLDDDFDPFGAELFDLVPIRTNRAEAKTETNQAKMILTGPLLALPAGNIQATTEGHFISTRLRSKSDFSPNNQKGNFRRNETGLRGAIDVPLTTHDGFGAAIGDLSATAEYTRFHYSDAGNAGNYELGLAWEPRRGLRFLAELEKTSVPPTVRFLGDPTVVTNEVRTFDSLTGDTVDVTQISGGNSDLGPERSKLLRLAGLVRLIERLNLQLTAEYTDRKDHNFVSFLPEASAAVMLAFPDRFIRDPGGVLTTVDLRPVNFDSHREKRFRYGLSLSTRLGQSGRSAARIAAPDLESGEEGESRPDAPPSVALRGPQRPATRVSLTASHSIILKDEIVIRSGLAAVDLLDGGAIGIGGGRGRHQADATASITSGGTGVRLSATWRGRSTLNELNVGTPDTLSFSPVFNLNLRAFADLHRFLPKFSWTRGMRLSLNVLNATNHRQKVRDSDGQTQLRYQPGYRDPLGRTIELELRKVF